MRAVRCTCHHNIKFCLTFRAARRERGEAPEQIPPSACEENHDEVMIQNAMSDMPPNECKVGTTALMKGKCIEVSAFFIHNKEVEDKMIADRMNTQAEHDEG